MNSKIAKALSLACALSGAALLSSCSSTDSDGAAPSASLPAKPSKAQAKDYVAKTIAPFKGAAVPKSDAAQVKALAKVGPENADVLIDSLGADQAQNALLAFALVKVADDSNKALIVSKLTQKPVLSSVVFAKEWEKDAAPQLLAGLRDSKTGLPYDWLRSSAKVKGPDAKRLLKDHFIRHPYGAAYSVMEESKIQFAPAELDKAFAGLKAIDRGLDVKMAKAGSKLALEHVVFAWKSAGKECPASTMELAGYKGSAAAFPAWFEANKAKLEFDKDKGRFELAKAPAK